jgi:AcrR family transcriptional regulator
VLEVPKRDRRAERREATKAEIVDAAWELCAAEGLAGLSLRDLAARVGMQAPSLYSYFASKHDIYDAMFAEGFRQFNFQRTLLDGGSTLEALRAVAHRFADFSTSNPVRYQLMFQRTIPGFEPSAESYAISAAGFADFAAWAAARGIDHVIDMYTGIITGLVDQQISNEPGGDRWLRLIDDAMEMLLAYAESTRPQKKTPKRSRK